MKGHDTGRIKTAGTIPSMVHGDCIMADMEAIGFMSKRNIDRDDAWKKSVAGYYKAEFEECGILVAAGCSQRPC